MYKHRATEGGTGFVSLQEFLTFALGERDV